MTSQPDYYAALRLDPAATQQEISRAYRALMRTHHPDVHAGPAADRETRDAELLRIMQAFSVLRDPVRRAAYDRTVTGGDRPSDTATDIPVRKVPSRAAPAGTSIRITPVHWESGPWI
ncbi:J domain-containing protein [Pseudarthrobacter sp. YS3]|uniref:J domain-containing protein n=1 Tax=Pseudarthrobacter sp. YS3 TaxID=3453718 RepID=UPI003EEC07E8